MPPDDRVRLRLRLVFEEAFELLDACLHDNVDKKQAGMYSETVRQFVDCAKMGVDLVAAADALADLDYVVEGTRLEFGIDGAPIAAEVHRSNMAKVWPDGTVRKTEGGKVVKPPNWTPPYIRTELVRQGAWGEGLRGAPIAAEVHRSNMAEAWPDGTVRGLRGPPTASSDIAATGYTMVTKIGTERVSVDLVETVKYLRDVDRRVAALATRLGDGVPLHDEVSSLNRLVIELAERFSRLEERVDHHVVDVQIGNKAPIVTLATAAEVLDLSRLVDELAKRLSQVSHFVNNVAEQSQKTAYDHDSRIAVLAKRLTDAEEAIRTVTKGLLLR